MAPDNSLVTVIALGNSVEAHVIKSKLESEEIECFIADEHTINANPLYSNALGGVKVQVRCADLARAQEILGIHPEVRAAPTTCPKCGSKHVTFSKWPGILNLLAFLSLNAFFPRSRLQWNCKACGNSWRA